MKQSFPKCNQSDMEFVISTNEKQQEEVRFLSGDFPVSVYTQHYRHAASDYVPLHWHGELQVLWIAEGALEYSVNGRHFVLGPDKLLLVNRRQLHGSRTMGGDTRTLCINFTPDIFHPLIRENYVLPLLQSDSFTHSLLLLLPYQTEKLKTFLNWKCEPLQYFSVINFLSLVFEDILGSSENTKNPQNYEEIKLIQTMIRFVQTHYAEPLTVRQISAYAITNKNRCTALFRKYTGLSPIKYLNEYRLYTAKNMIVNSDKPISEISANVGYNQISYFIEQFRGSYGLPPLKYRNQFGRRQPEMDAAAVSGASQNKISG